MSGSAVTAREVLVITTETGDFHCAEGDTLLRAALRADEAATYECNSGGCGSCKFTPKAGAFEQLQDEPSGLSARDRRKGRLLACQSVPVGDCEVALTLDPAATHPTRPGVRMGEVVERRDLTHDIFEVTVKVGEPASFLPGQYAMVSSADATWSDSVEQLRGERAYSMSNLSNDEGLWQFQIKAVPGGRISSELLRSATVGARLRIDGPYGHAYLRDSGRDVLCIAGGSGLAPIVSVCRGLADRDDASQRSLHFFYGGRAVRDLCATEFVQEVGERLDHTTLVEVLSDPEDGTWEGLRGFVHEAVHAADLPDLHERDIYVAGPPAMTDAVVRLLILDLNVSADHIYYDRFF